MCSHSLLAKRIITFAFFKGNTDEQLVSLAWAAFHRLTIFSEGFSYGRI